MIHVANFYNAFHYGSRTTKLLLNRRHKQFYNCLYGKPTQNKTNLEKDVK